MYLQTFLSWGPHKLSQGPDILRNVIVSGYVALYQTNKFFVKKLFIIDNTTSRALVWRPLPCNVTADWLSQVTRDCFYFCVRVDRQRDVIIITDKITLIFLNFLDARIAAISFFQSFLINHEITYGIRYHCHRCPPFVRERCSLFPVSLLKDNYGRLNNFLSQFLKNVLFQLAWFSWLFDACMHH